MLKISHQHPTVAQFTGLCKGRRSGGGRLNATEGLCFCAHEFEAEQAKLDVQAEG
jgi:hypothetical protein